MTSNMPLTSPSSPSSSEMVQHLKSDGKPDYTQRWTKIPPPPPIPTDEQFWLPGRTKPNAAFVRRHFYHEGRLREDQALWILQEVTKLLRTEPNVLSVTSPVTICGDIHGQYYDLVRMMEPNLGGSASKTQYLFLGDYVDRGSFGIECILLLYALKLNYPKNFLLLRGNHECRRLTDYFTFRLESRRKYSDAVYDAAVESFNALPLAAVVDRTLFCVHGGLSPELETVEDIQVLNRFQETPTKGLMCDLLWSDPARDHSHEEIDFVANPQRGCSYFYGYKAVRRFLDRNQFTLLIRAHEVEEQGYRSFNVSGHRTHLMTIFSAPNYLDIYNNLGAVMVYDQGKMSVRQFKYSDHPYWLPNFSDAFSWSLPYVALKAAEMLKALMNVFVDEESDDDSPIDLTPGINLPKDERVLTVLEGNYRKTLKDPRAKELERVRRVWALLREDSEGASEFKDLEDNPHPAWDDNLRGGASPVRPGTPFQDVRKLDLINERIPGYFIEYASYRRRDNTPSPYNTPRLQQQLIYEEPGEMGGENGVGQMAGYIVNQYVDEYVDEHGFIDNSGAGMRRQSVGTTYKSSPSLRRRRVEQQDELIQRFANWHISTPSS